MPTTQQDLEVLFNNKVDKSTDPDGCWLWTGHIDRDGYATWSTGHKRLGTIRAQRCSYLMFVGPIPDGLTIDHICKVRHCVNPLHLQPLTIGDNIRRGWNATKTHCPHGHEYTEENTSWYRNGTSRSCRTCRRIQAREYQRVLRTTRR